LAFPRTGGRFDCDGVVQLYRGASRFFSFWIYLCAHAQHTPPTQTRGLTQAEGMVTQLLFEHSLRIRMQAGDPEPAAEDTEDGREHYAVDETTVTHMAEGSDAQTLVASGSTLPIKGDDSNGTGTEENSRISDSNLVGKINNLMSSVSAPLICFTSGSSNIFWGCRI
jgi:hypothetical protein